GAVPLASGTQAVELRDGGLERVDTACAMALYERLIPSDFDPGAVSVSELPESPRNIFRLVAEKYLPSGALPAKRRRPLTERVGHGAHEFVLHVVGFVAFLGETFLSLLAAIRNPRLFRIRETAVQLELTCVDAIPIVGLVTFL